MNLPGQCTWLFDEGIINLVHPAAGSLLDGVMKGFTFLGNPFIYIIALAVLYWCVDKKTAILIGIVFFLSVVVNTIAKGFFNAPRPDPEKLTEAVRRLHALHAPRSPGFPSGHTQTVTAFWIAAGHYTRMKSVWCAGIILVLLVPYSRLYLGVHFPGDIVGGYLVALISLAIAVPGVAFLERLDRTLPALPAMIASLAAPWLVYPVVPDIFLLRMLSFCAGSAAGLLLADRIKEFDPRRRFHIQVVKALIGLAGLGVIQLAFFPLPNMAVSHYARFLLSGFWVTFGAPWVFCRVPSLTGDTKLQGSDL